MKFTIKMLASRAIVDITDLIGCGGYYASDMRAALNKAKAVKDITVRLSSDGGDIAEGLGIYSMLMAHPAKVRVEVVGVAASMGSVIAMAGDEVAMYEDSYMMIHNPSAGVQGESDDMRERADLLDMMRDTIAGIYQRRTGLDRSAIVAAMNAETWMTAAEALKIGYCTEIIKAKSMAARRVARRFINTPNALRRATAKGNNMDPELLAKLGLGDDATLEDVMAAIDVLQKAATPEPDADDAPANDDDAPPPTDADDDAPPAPDKDKDAQARRQMRAALKANKGDRVLNAVLALTKTVSSLGARIDGNERVTLMKANARKFTPKLEKAAKNWPLDVLREFVVNADDVHQEDDEPEIDGDARPAARSSNTDKSGKRMKLTAEELHVCKLTKQDPAEMLAFINNGHRLPPKLAAVK